MTTLAELRQANLKEQKKSSASESKPGDLAVQLNLAPSEPASTLAPVAPVSAISKVEETNSEVEPSVNDEQSVAFLLRVRQALSGRTMHPVGSKVTTDMSPALFMRAKRYCVDHGNITLRQVFLDLLINFLQEEGY